MRTEKLNAISVDRNGQEFYEVGKYDVTAIEWGEFPGLHCNLDTVRVFINGKLHSEHPFCNCAGIYFALPTEREAE